MRKSQRVDAKKDSTMKIANAKIEKDSAHSMANSPGGIKNSQKKIEGEQQVVENEPTITTLEKSLNDAIVGLKDP